MTFLRQATEEYLKHVYVPKIRGYLFISDEDNNYYLSHLRGKSDVLTCFGKSLPPMAAIKRVINH